MNNKERFLNGDTCLVLIKVESIPSNLFGNAPHKSFRALCCKYQDDKLVSIGSEESLFAEPAYLTIKDNYFVIDYKTQDDLEAKTSEVYFESLIFD